VDADRARNRADIHALEDFGTSLRSVPESVEFVLFDLGGVLIELGDLTRLQEIGDVVGNEVVWHEWLASPWVRRFETGQCSAGEFAIGVLSEWDLDIAPERFLEIFRDWPIGPYPGTAELLAEIQEAVPIGCLSNTNSMHWTHQASLWPELAIFDYRFLSFELGLAKPDPEIFQAVTDRLPFSPAQVLFLDDVSVNVHAARDHGFRSACVRSTGEVTTVLRDVGLLTG
jgi:glucose-1-phosphatase